jgi:hypothetical protein
VASDVTRVGSIVGAELDEVQLMQTSYRRLTDYFRNRVIDILTERLYGSQVSLGRWWNEVLSGNNSLNTHLPYATPRHFLCPSVFGRSDKWCGMTSSSMSSNQRWRSRNRSLSSLFGKMYNILLGINWIHCVYYTSGNLLASNEKHKGSMKVHRSTGCPQKFAFAHALSYLRIFSHELTSRL